MSFPFGKLKRPDRNPSYITDNDKIVRVPQYKSEKNYQPKYKLDFVKTNVAIYQDKLLYEHNLNIWRDTFEANGLISKRKSNVDAKIYRETYTNTDSTDTFTNTDTEMKITSPLKSPNVIDDVMIDSIPENVPLKPRSNMLVPQKRESLPQSKRVPLQFIKSSGSNRYEKIGGKKFLKRVASDDTKESKRFDSEMTMLNSGDKRYKKFGGKTIKRTSGKVDDINLANINKKLITS